MNAGTLTIEMAANVARLANDMEQAKKIVGGASAQISQTIGTLKSLLGTLGIGLSVGYFVSFIKGTNDAIAHMKELGQEAGTSGEAISRFEAPARSAGLSLETVAAAIFKMNKAALEAKDPQSRAADALRAIGISTAQLKGLKPDEMFELVARSVAKYSDGLEKNNVMQELFGKSGREMNRVVAEIAERGTLAATVTQEQVEASKKLNDQTLELKMNSEKFWRGVVSEGVPALNEIVKAFIQAKEEGGLFSGVIAALRAYGGTDQQRADKRMVELTEQRLNLENAISRVRSQGFFGGIIGPSEAKIQGWLDDVNRQLRETMAFRKVLSGEGTGAPVTGTPAAKPKIDFDPVEAEKRRKLAFEQAKQRQEDQDDEMKGLLAHYAHLVALRNEEIALSQKYQDVAAAEVAMRAKQGEAIAQGLDTEAQIEQRSYDERLAALMAYFATKEDFTVQDQARLEALQRQHEFNMLTANSMGIKSRTDIEKMGLDGQLAYYTGTLANITAAGAQHDKRLFELNKIAGIANAIISTQIGAAAALKWGWPMGPIFAAIIYAAGIANVRAIAATKFGGGSSAPSVGAGGATPVFPAPNVGIPQETIPQGGGTTVQIFIDGNLIGNEDYVYNTLVPAIVDGVANRDLRLLPPQSRNAQDIRDNSP